MAAKNPHLADTTLRPFLSPTFSPIDHLNTCLSPAASAKPQHTSPSLSTLASQTQSHISTLNAQQSRLSTTLTALTDDILRTSSRLAYEVELLRGEAVSLAETLSPTGELHSSILKFVPEGLEDAAASPIATKSPKEDEDIPTNPPPTDPSRTTPTQTLPHEPPSLPHLRTLLHVRTMLQQTIQTFNAALSFPFPPSLTTSTTSALISVTSPNIDPAAETKGQAALARMKSKVTDSLQTGDIDGARKRVAELRDLCLVWKGTSEERARGKWVDGLEGLVEEVTRREDVSAKAGGMQGKGDGRDVKLVASETGGGGPGFLRRLREEIYMD